MFLHRILLSLSLAGACVGCKQAKERTAPAAADSPAKSPKASPLTATPPVAPAAPVASTPPAKTSKDPSIAFAELKAKQEAQGGAIEWEQLVPLFPDRIGAFKAEGKVMGRTQDLGNGAKATMARREYKAGERSMHMAIGDSFLNPMASFGLKHNVKLDHADDAGFAKTSKLGDYPTLLSWKKASAVSQCIVLIDDRLLEVVVDKAHGPDEAEVIAKKISFSAIAKLRAKPKE
jgi:hypothetical protein